MITDEDMPNKEQDLAFVSSEAKDLINQLLQKDPSSRPSAFLALSHSWL